MNGYGVQGVYDAERLLRTSADRPKVLELSHCYLHRLRTLPRLLFLRRWTLHLL